MIQIRNLEKTYSKRIALRNVSIDIARGFFGLLGPNGAGKSTLMRILATVQAFDSGTVSIFDDDLRRSPDAIRRYLGYVPQEFGFYPNISAASLLTHFAKLKGITEKEQRGAAIERALADTNLTAFANLKLRKFSGGMKQGFGIAIALVGNPKLLIVDEPTAGLDPDERDRFLNLLSQLASDRIVIMSTHIVEDIAAVCTSMAIILNGSILLQGSPKEAVEQMRGRVWQTECEFTALEDLRARHVETSHIRNGDKVLFRVHASQCPGEEFLQVQPTLKDVYFTTIRDSANKSGSISGP